MSFAGLAGRAALLVGQMNNKPCKRCGLQYNPKKEKKCPHCGDLDDQGLARLLERKESEFQSNRSLGGWFLFAAVVVLVLMVLGIRG